MTWPVHGLAAAWCAAAIGLACGLLLYRTISRYLRRIILRRRFLRGAQGEHEAQIFLTRHHYRIIEIQPRRELCMVVDGTPVTYEVRADFIVQKKRKTYLVEVKTGTRAIDPASTDTRRQLLEYALAYHVDGIRLFDAEAGVLHEVEMPIAGVKQQYEKATLFATAAAGILLGGLAVWMMLMVSG